MIDRKAIWISVAFTALMLVATIWRIAFLPDWTLFPVDGGETNVHSHGALWLFVGPVWMVLYIGIFASQIWLKRGPQEEIRPWRKWYSNLLISGGAFMTVLQFFMIARSLGMATSLDWLAVARAGFVLIGSMIAIGGNQVPKLPWLSSRLAILDLAPAQGAKLLRFTGRLNVAAGIGIVVCGWLAPTRLLLPLMMVIIFGCIGSGILRRIQLKREQLR